MPNLDEIKARRDSLTREAGKQINLKGETSRGLSSGLFSSASDMWETPQWLFDALNKRFCFTLDVCAVSSSAKCTRYLSPKEDGLAVGWEGERCWMNPPYGKAIVHWVEKACKEAERGALVVGLIPARTDTFWWQNHVIGHADIHFISGRLKFGKSKNSAPFPSAIAVWWGCSMLSDRAHASRQVIQLQEHPDD